jgi:hypothetical protein
MRGARLYFTLPEDGLPQVVVLADNEEEALEVLRNSEASRQSPSFRKFLDAGYLALQEADARMLVLMPAGEVFVA